LDFKSVLYHFRVGEIIEPVSLAIRFKALMPDSRWEPECDRQDIAQINPSGFDHR
jgi:hypothetical protein